MRSPSIEQIVLFVLVIGLPLFRSIAGLIRKRNLSSRRAEAAPSDTEQETSWLRGHDDNQPWSRRNDHKSTPPAPRVTLRPARREVSQVAPPTLRHSVWQMAAAPVEKAAAPTASRKRQPPLPSARPSASSVVRQIPRDQLGQRRAIVLMAVFGPPRALDPPP
jgi:hypothetical protein